MTFVTAASAPNVAPADALISGAADPPRPHPCSHGTGVLFRIAANYFVLFAFSYGNGTIFGNYGKVGSWIQTGLTWPLAHFADFVSTHLLHYTGVGATHHPTGSGDTLVQWVEQWLFVGIAVVGGVVWSAVAAVRGHRRLEYTMAHASLRFLLRLTCGMFLLSYGLVKLFPLQMAPISTAILNEPVGAMSPMTMLWSLIALHPAYQMICGATEMIGGILLLFRRTALVGALLGAFVMTNVLLYNIFFDVPVKLFAANLLLALVFIMLPDMPAMFRFFWLHQPAAPAGVWIPPVSRRRFRLATRGVELFFVLTFLLWMPYQIAKGWESFRKDTAAPMPIRGDWRVDNPTASFASPEQQPITAMYLDSPTLVRVRSADGDLWRAWMDPDDKQHTYTVQVYTTGSHATFAWTMPDANHLLLTAVELKGEKPAAGAKFTPFSLALTRMPTPAHYFLLDRGFHAVNEWGLER